MTPRLTYFKRHRMEVELRRPFPAAHLPDGFVWLAWDDRHLGSHAETKFRSFQGEADADIFPSLGSADGCHRLMRAIRGRATFCPAATWLLAAPDGFAGTVQGLCDAEGIGLIQNLGVVPGYRRLGLGAALLARAIAGFREAGAKRVSLEVTAQNVAAVRLYRGFGFRSVRTIYKAAPALDSRAAAAKL